MWLELCTNLTSGLLQTKGKDNGCPTTDQKGSEGEHRYSSTFPLTSAQDGGGWSTTTPAALPQRKRTDTNYRIPNKQPPVERKPSSDTFLIGPRCPPPSSPTSLRVLRHSAHTVQVNYILLCKRIHSHAIAVRLLSDSSFTEGEFSPNTWRPLEGRNRTSRFSANCVCVCVCERACALAFRPSSNQLKEIFSLDTNPPSVHSTVAETRRCSSQWFPNAAVLKAFRDLLPC